MLQAYEQGFLHTNNRYNSTCTVCRKSKLETPPAVPSKHKIVATVPWDLPRTRTCPCSTFRTTSTGHSGTSFEYEYGER
eukprot:scaffold378028_cov15-Prasinocladus_malaysianus.AAC.1